MTIKKWSCVFMLNRDGFMSNGCMMEVSNEAMKHPEWKILNKYCFICNKDINIAFFVTFGFHLKLLFYSEILKEYLILNY